MALIIIGGGIVGLSIAYYTSLSDPTRDITIIDSETSLLLSASGFSGGYIVRDWFSPSVLPLAELSFMLHRELAGEFDGAKEWGYTASTAFSAVYTQTIDAKGTGKGRDGLIQKEVKQVRGEDWLLHGTSRADVARKYISALAKTESGGDVARDELLRPDGTPVWANLPAGGGVFEKISTAEGCAQVEPRELCEWLLAQCRARGVRVRLSTTATGFVRKSRGTFEGVVVEQRGTDGVRREVLLCKDVVVAAGCWSPRVFDTLVGRKMNPSVRPLPGYSMVVRSPRYSRSIFQQNDSLSTVEMSHATFYPPTKDWKYSPEAMARMTRSGKPEIYIAGLNDERLALPALAGQSRAMMDKRKLDDLKKTALTLTGNTILGKNEDPDDLELVRKGLCFRPVSTSGVPIISPVKDIQSSTGGGLYVATGHGPWGITLSLATGFIMAEMLEGKDTSISVAPFALTEDGLRARL